MILIMVDTMFSYRAGWVVAQVIIAIYGNDFIEGKLLKQGYMPTSTVKAKSAKQALLLDSQAKIE